MPAELSADQLAALRATARAYTLVILRPGPRRHDDGVDAIIHQHGMRNIALHVAGMLPIVCPVTADRDVSGIGLFDRTVDEVTALMDDDPGVRAGVFVYDVYPVRSFPGSTLPGPEATTAS